MKIMYVHGAKAIDKARDWEKNPTVELGENVGKDIADKATSS
jgi:hypothetical protein